MALELYDGSLRGISGKFYEDEVFKIENEELEDFEKQFPYKEKHVTDTQLKLWIKEDFAWHAAVWLKDKELESHPRT